MSFSLGDRFNTASISGASSTYQQSQYNLPGKLFENSTNITSNQSSNNSNLTSENHQTYYDQNVDTSPSETEEEKGGLFQWLYDNVYSPQLEVQQQQAEMELQATAPVVDAYESVYKYATDETVRDATNLALKTSAQTATVDVVASFKSAALTLGSLFASYAQTQSVMDSYAGSNPLGIVTNEETAQMMREDVQESNERSQETFTQVIEPMIANIYLDAENWKEEHIYNVNVNGTNLTVRQYIANYSVIKEGSLIWNLEASIVNMLPYIIVNVVAGPAAGTCTFAVQCFGGSINSAYAGGATFEEAFCYAALSTFIEVSIERVSTGLGGVVGTRIANNGAIQSLLNTAKNSSGLIGNLSNSAVMRTIANLCSNSIGEGIEEVISDVANPFICKMTYLQEEDLAVLWADSKDQMLNDFVIGALSSGIMQSPFLYNSVRQQQQNIQAEQQKAVADMVTEYNNLPQGVKTVLKNIEQRMATDLDHATITEADMQAMLTTPSLLSQELSPEFKTGAQIQTDITSVLENTNIQADHLDSTVAQQLGAIVATSSASTVSSVLSKADTQSLNQRLSLNPLAFEHLLEIGLNASLLVEDGKNNSIKLNGVYDIHNFLIDHNSTYKQAWEAISSNKYVNCNLEMATNNNSYYQKNQGVRIDNDIILSNSIETYFHEVGHALLASNVIDFKIKNRQFNQLLKKHKKSIMRNQQILSAYNAQFRRLATDMANQIASQKNFNWPAERTQYIGQLSEGIERNSGFTAISDIYDAVTNGKARDSGVVSYGHGSSYYTSSRSRFHETFANFHAIICINNPTLTKMAKTLLGDEIWNFLLQTYNEAHNTHITPKNVGTTDAMSWFPGETLAALESEYTSVVQPNMSQVTNQSIDTNYNEINVKTTDTISLFESQSTIRESRSDLNADQIINSDIDLNQEEIRQILHMGFETTMLGELINKDSDMSQAIYDINKFLKGKFPTYAEAWQRIHENWAVRCSLSLSQVESFYDGKGVKIDVNSVQSNYFEVYFHEVGHALLSSCLFHYYQFVEQINPYINYYGKKMMDNEQLLVNYWKEIMSNATVIAEQEASSKTFSSDAERLDYVNNLSEAIIRNSGFASVIDIYDALTGGKAFSNGDISYGHGRWYYENRPKDTQFQEMFADFHALKCINNAKAIDFGRKLIGDDIWNILENVYDVIINHKMSGDIRTTRVLADRNAPTYRSSNLATNYVQKFDYIIQNMSQKYPDWLLHLQTYAKDGNLNHITRYNHCRSVVQDIPFAEFQQMINFLDTNHIITSMAEDQMLKDLPRVVNQFLSNEGTAYRKLININSIAKDYPSLYEYNQFMNKYSEQNGYMILDQNGYFKHIKYGIQPESIEHRLYINCEPTVTYQFLDYFAEECKRQGLSFYFKTAYLYDNVGNPQNQNALTRSESAVIYMSGEDAIKYINICKKIKHDHPELNFYAPPVATGSIDGWLGYGKEPSGLTRQIAQAEGISLSFNSIRSLILERGIYSGIKKCISRNMYFQYDNGYTLYGALANELFNEIVTRYPNLSLDSKNILYNNLFTNPDMFMKAINSSRSGWSFYAKTEGSSQLTTFLVDSNMVNRSLSNVYYQYLSNDPAVYTYITNSIKDEANYFHIDTEHLYMDQ